jgi:hypothetical protein
VASTLDLADRDYAWAYLPEFLDGDLSGADSARVEKLLAEQSKDKGEKFQAARGKLQLALQSYWLREDEIQRLHALIEDPEIRQTREIQRIEAGERREQRGTMLRRVILTIIAASIIFGVFWILTPRSVQKFDALEYLGYEALMMDEDPEGRLDLPSQDMSEIALYLENYPNLEFKPVVLRNVPGSWEPAGGHVIDYEIAKVAVVKYYNPELKDTLYHFSFAGRMKDLPKAVLGKEKNFEYQTYASDQFNIVAWQASDDVLCFLVGRRSAPEMASFARLGSGP